MSANKTIRVRVAAVTPAASAVKRFRLEPIDGASLPPFAGGAHVTVHLDDGGHQIRNAYSLMGSPRDLGAYEISVARSETSRGGSTFLHDRVAVGSELDVSAPVNLFPRALGGRKHLLVAGGIGITPFIPMMEQMAEAAQPFELHYAMRSGDSGAYGAALAARFPGKVRLYVSDEGTRLDLSALVAHQPLGTHLYVCGPERLIDGALGAARDAGWPEPHLHCEHFAAAPSGVPFVLRLARSGRTISVGARESMLEALEAAGLTPDYLCRGGACGQCATSVVGCDGRLDHHDHYLSADQKASNRSVIICVSRFEGRELALDL